MKNIFPLLTKPEQDLLYHALHYMKVSELKKSCAIFALATKDQKATLIMRITQFIATGKVSAPNKIPAIANAANHPAQHLAANNLMLYGNYKNDLKTRNFFKKLIGPHFHFTAFGIDWLNEHWFAGKPPTYQAFANYWSKEYAQRKIMPVPPKAEWAYLRFLQQVRTEQPNITNAALLTAWQTLRTQQAELAKQLLAKAKNKLI